MKVSTFIAGIAALASSVAASAASYDYDPAKVIAAMRRVDPKLKIIIAHRGIYGSQCPENSLCSINRTVETGIEAVEIDVKESQDGIPWPSHDMTAGRGTTYNRNGIFFDPYHKSASNDANNPAISDLSEAQLLSLALRDIDGNVVASNRSMNLRELLYHAARAHNNLVFVFDIKFPQSVRKVAQIAKDLGIGDRVVLKFSATFFQPLQVYQQTLGLSFAPTLYSPQMDEIAGKWFLNEPNLQNRVFYYMNAFQAIRGFTYYEIGNKMFNRAGSSVGVEGPMANLTNRLSGERLPIGNFIPVTEHKSSNPQQTGFYHTDGYCCTQLINFVSHTRHFGNETRDDRPVVDMQVRFNENVITDNANSARWVALLIGSRQNEYLIMR